MASEIDGGARDPKNCNCGREARKPMKMRIVGGKKIYLDDAGNPVDEATLAPPPRRHAPLTSTDDEAA